MSIFKESIIYVFGEVFSKSLPFLLLPYLTRELGVAGFGELSLYQTYLAIITVFFSLCQDGAVTRYFYKYGKRNLPYLVLTGYLYTMIVAFGGLIIAGLFQSLLWASVILAGLAQSALSTQLAIRQCQKMAMDYVAIQLGAGLLSTLFTVALLEITKNYAVAWRFFAIFLASFLMLCWAGWIFWKSQTFLIKKKPTIRLIALNFGYILSIGLPVLFHQLSSIAKGQFDRIFVYQKFSLESLGIYAAGYQVAMVFSVLLIAINKATIPYYYQSIKSGIICKKKAIHWALYSCILIPIPAIMAMLIPESVFLILLGEDYVGIKYYICLFLLAFGLTIPYLFLVNFLFYYARNKQISFVSVISVILYIVLLIILSDFGLMYMPIALIASNVMMVFFLVYLVARNSDNVNKS